MENHGKPMRTHAAKIGQLTFKVVDSPWMKPSGLVGRSRANLQWGVHFITLTVCELEHGPARNSGFTMIYP